MLSTSAGAKRPAALVSFFEDLEEGHGREADAHPAHVGARDRDDAGVLAQVREDVAGPPPQRKDGRRGEQQRDCRALRRVAGARKVARADGLRQQRVRAEGESDERRVAGHVGPEIGKRDSRKRRLGDVARHGLADQEAEELRRVGRADGQRRGSLQAQLGEQRRRRRRRRDGCGGGGRGRHPRGGGVSVEGQRGGKDTKV